MTLDFTAEKYAEICRALLASDYECITLSDYLQQSGKEKFAIIRHDVDRFPHAALELAKIENNLEIRASYYFRQPASWDVPIVKEVGSLGHEVGLHDEVLDKAKGDLEAARKQMREDLMKFNGIAEVTTVAMHGNPLTPFDNRDFWRENSFEDFGLLGEAYLSVDFSKLLYYSDTGRTWHESRYNIFDKVPSQQSVALDRPDAHRTSDLINIIQMESRNLYILTHPERWPDTLLKWPLSFMRDVAANLLKAPLKYYFAVRKTQSKSP